MFGVREGLYSTRSHSFTRCFAITGLHSKLGAELASGVAASRKSNRRACVAATCKQACASAPV